MAGIQREDSLDIEDMFITDTAKLAKLFAELQREQKVTAASESYGAIAKGVGPSRPALESSSSSSGQSSMSRASPVDDARLNAAAVHVGSRLRALATQSNAEVILTQQYDRFVPSIWDMSYDMFEELCRDVWERIVVSNTEHWNKIVLVFGTFFKISESLREAGGDASRQNEFSMYVGRLLVEQGLHPWVQQHGGWKQIGETFSGLDSSTSPFNSDGSSV